MKSLYSRIVVVVMAIVFTSGAIAFMLSNLHYQVSVKKVNEEKIMVITKDIIDFYEKNPSLNINSYLKNVTDLQYQISLFDKNKKLQTFGEPFKENVIDESVIQSVLDGKTYNGIEKYQSNIFVTGFFKDDIQNSIGMPIVSNGETYAMFLRPNIKQQFGELHLLFAFMLGLAFLLSILAILFFSRRIVKPIKQLAQATHEVARGNFHIHTSSQRRDELGSLFRDFKSMADSLQKLEDMRQEFVSNVSHEIKSPLTSIKGFAQILQNNHLSTEQRSHYLSIIIEESSRVSLLSQQLLTLASLDSEAKKINIESFCLQKQLQEVVLSLESRWAEKDITIEIDAMPIHLKGDQILLHQVWSNLIENSIKFCPENSILSIETEIDGQLEIIIRDNGPGIEKEHLNRLFERFYKVDHNRNRVVKGSGLGLSIVDKIVTLHNGKIIVESEVGKGTAFRVIFPLHMLDRNQ